MEKEFVPYELAVKLKSFGFDEPCFGYYIERGEWVPASYSNEGTVYPKNSDLFSNWVSAPTFSQCFRWFREKYNLHCAVNTHTSSTNQLTYVCSLEFGKKLTYEEAELACLTKLIEIVENGK